MPGNKLLGIKLIIALFKLFPESNFGTVGANPDTLKIYKSLGFKTGNLKNFVSFNKELKNFQIIKPNNLIISKSISNYKNSNLNEISKKVNLYIEEINNTAFKNSSYKNYEYLKNRYINHPFFNYELWFLRNKKVICFFVSRRILFKNSSLLKIVDFIGCKDDLYYFNNDLQQVMLRESEYIEFRSFGLEKGLENAGFFDLTNCKDIIIPAYYDPFVFKNKIIYWSLKILDENGFLVTGDCDQDRPNSLNI